jgi:hypothetical protein
LWEALLKWIKPQRRTFEEAPMVKRAPGYRTAALHRGIGHGRRAAPCAGQLEQTLPEEPAKTQTTADLNGLMAVCEQLEDLLVKDSAEAVEVLDANSDMLNAAFPNNYGKIAEGIQTYNYDKALTKLRTDIAEIR